MLSDVMSCRVWGWVTDDGNARRRFKERSDRASRQRGRPATLRLLVPTDFKLQGQGPQQEIGVLTLILSQDTAVRVSL